MKNVVSIIDGELRLCSGLGEYAFGKTNYNSIVTQKGLLAQCDSKPDEPLHFSFTPWTFGDIKSFDIEAVSDKLFRIEIVLDDGTEDFLYITKRSTEGN